MAARIKQKSIRATVANKDVMEMFEGMLGNSEGSANLALTWPKYMRIHTHAMRFVTLLSMFPGTNAMKPFPGAAEALRVYAASLAAQHAESFRAPDLERWVVRNQTSLVPDDYSRIAPEAVAEFSRVFGAVKKCNLVNLIIVTCKNLVPYKKSIEALDALADRFITKSATMALTPLPDLPELNFKQIYIDDRQTPADRHFVLVVLHKIYRIGHDLYDAVSSPDIDVDEFVQVIMSSMSEIKRHIPRCEQAFAKIEESVGLLRNNFDGYYQDFLGSNNPSIIMESFVLDVSKNSTKGSSSPTLAAQFGRIIAHYRKQAQLRATDPRLQTLFAKVDSHVQELAAGKKAADSAAADEDDDSSDESATDPAAPIPATTPLADVVPRMPADTKQIDAILADLVEVATEEPKAPVAPEPDTEWARKILAAVAPQSVSPQSVTLQTVTLQSVTLQSATPQSVTEES